MTVMIGIDPHKATHTAVAIDGREVELGRLKVRASKRQIAQLLAWADGVRGADVGDRVRRRARLSARAAARRRGRDGGRCARDAGGAGAGAGHRPFRQERPERRPVGRGRGAARAGADGGAGRGPRDGAAAAGRSATSTWAGGATRCAVGCTRWSRAGAGRDHQGNRCRTSLPAPRRASDRRAPPPSNGTAMALELVEDLVRIDDPDCAESRRRITAAVAAREPRSPRSSVSARSSLRCSSATPATPAASPPGPLRRLQRHRPDRVLLGWPQDPPTLAAREPHARTTRSTWPRSPRSATRTVPAAATTTASSPKARPRRKRSAR